MTISESDLRNELGRRVVVLDGAMATMTGSHDEPCCDLLNLTAPMRVADIHSRYIDAGADIITTNTFNANSLSLSEYGLQDKSDEINRAGAMIARETVGGRRVWVAGCMGPIVGKGLDDTTLAYARQSQALIEGSVDLLMVESVIDLAVAEAALRGIRLSFEQTGVELPIMVSAIPTESGRLLSGHTLGEFRDAVIAYKPLSVGLNCGFGASRMLDCLPDLVAGASCFISCHPGVSDESPESFAAVIGEMTARRLVNIVGGCCGTTPAHIAAISRRLEGSLL